MVRGFRKEFGALALMLSVATVASAADHDAAISGVVRDVRGVPQMGAVVQILSANAVVRATAYTDLQGRYTVARLLPGSYGVRASAALFLPALRSDLRLQPGHRSVVNLTLSALFDEAAWLPVRARGKDELSDDWNWTLRSSAGRPILKVAEDEDAAGRARIEGPRPRSVTHVRARVTSPSNRFSEGMVRVEVAGERKRADGASLAVVTSAAADARGGAGARDVSMRYERPLGIGGAVGGRGSYVLHPEIALGSGSQGIQVLSISSAERFGVGDFGEIEAGSRVQAVTGPASLTVMRPFVRVGVHPATGWLLLYHLATAPDTQDYEDATASDGDVPVLGYVARRARVAGGLHQEISLAHKSRGTVLAVACYTDALDEVELSGRLMGQEQGAGANSGDGAVGDGLRGAMVDRSNGTFETLGQGYGASGVNVVLTQVLHDGAWVAFQYSSGAALGRSERTTAAGGADALPQLEAQRGQAATISVRASVPRAGTKARVSYRWQPGVLVTAIDPYDVSAGGEYLSFHVRQPLRLLGVLPEGLELTVDGGNLLHQGYRRFESGGGVPLYLASSPTTFQAGLAFSF